MQPVVDFTWPPMERLYDILIIIALSIIMIQLRNIIEQSMLMRYYTFWQNNVWSEPPKWIQYFEENLQVTYAKIDKYTPRDWRMYNEGKDSGYNSGYNQGLLEGHDNGWDEAKEYYQKIFERELREAKQLWKEEGINDEYSEEVVEEYEESEVDDEWSSYGQKRDSKHTESSDW
jgi:flagellar biosynthesis/type III secretory pathway protein FliH